jgi:hypothetical protein
MTWLEMGRRLGDRVSLEQSIQVLAEIGAVDLRSLSTSATWPLSSTACR